MRNFIILVVILFTAYSEGKTVFDESATFEFSSSLAKIRWLEGDFIRTTQGENTVDIGRFTIQDIDEEQAVLFDAFNITLANIIIIELSTKKGIVDIYSKEANKSKQTAQLIIKTIQGTSYLTPKVDTYVLRTARKPQGSKEIVKIGGKNIGLLMFEIPSELLLNLVDVQDIQLKLTTTNRQYGSAEIEVKQLNLLSHTAQVSQPGIANKYLSDKDISNDNHVYFAENFNQHSLWDSLSETVGLKTSIFGKNVNLTYIDHKDVNHFSSEQGQAIVVNYTKKKNLALNLDYYFKKNQGIEPEEAYFRYYLMVEPGSEISGGGKLPGFGGTYNKAGWGGRGNDGYKGWSARGAFYASINEVDSQWQGYMPIGQYIYEVGKDKYGQILPWGNELSTIQPGKWYSIEQRLKLNTPGESDGILEVWINGIKIFSKRDIKLRNLSKLKIEKIWFNFYFGGVAKPKNDFNIYIDNIVIASHYIGPYQTFE